MKDTSEAFLTPDEEATLLSIARDALEAWVRRSEQIDIETYALTPALREKHGAFVTLRIAGQLRGCIGYMAHRVPLAEAVRDNAVNASQDPRFPRVAPEELESITVEVSALTSGETPDTPFKPVNDIDEIVIGRDGLYIERTGSRGGILLPQVPVEQHWDVPQFLSAVCRKAGYADGAWEDPDVQLSRFSAQVFSEEAEA